MKIFILFSLGFMIINSFSIKAQEKERVNLSAGFGVPELLNAGIRIQSNQMQVALSIGSASFNEVSISGDVFYHFAGHSDFSARRPWYFRAGLTYGHANEESPFNLENMSNSFIKIFSLGLIDIDAEPYNVTFLNVRIGRDFNISKKVGINSDLGLGILKDEYGIEPMFVTSLSIFYRL